MYLGSLGTLSNQIFKEHNPASYKTDGDYVFLTIAIDVTSKYKIYYPEISSTIFELKWYYFDKDQEEVVTALFLSHTTTPDKVIATGGNYKSYSFEVNKCKYYKVLLTYKGESSVVFLHENSIDLFDFWPNKEKTNSREVF